MLSDFIGPETIHEVISELEQLCEGSQAVSLAAIYVLKNELEPSSPGDPKRRIEFHRTYRLPPSVMTLFAEHRSIDGFAVAVQTWWRGRKAWLLGKDAVIFRDRCDLAFWQQVVPDVSEHFGDMADVVLNTINEAIINYAEYSFGRWSWRRRVNISLFKTEGVLVYAIIRPYGGRMRSFDPLSLKAREIAPAKLIKRGWGHTLIIERALFLSFDHEPKRRGMLVILGPES